MFRRYRIATLLNLFGLSVAVATFYLFMTQVIYNRTYNHNLNDYEHTYRLEIYGNLFGDNWGCTICRPFATILGIFRRLRVLSITVRMSIRPMLR